MGWGGGGGVHSCCRVGELAGCRIVDDHALNTTLGFRKRHASLENSVRSLTGI